MKKQFKEAVQSNDLISVRLYLTNELLLDPRGKTFDEMLKFAENHCPELYETANSSFAFITDTASWNQAYLNRLKNEVDTLFLKNTLLHYKDVVLYVLKEKAENLNQQEKEPHSYISEENLETYKKVSCGALIGGGATLAVTGLCISKWLMAEIGLVCVAVGGYLVYKLIKK